MCLLARSWSGVLAVLVVIGQERPCLRGSVWCSGGEVHGAELLEDGRKHLGPGPPGGEVERVAAGGVGEAAGCGDERAADGVTGDLGVDGDDRLEAR